MHNSLARAQISEAARRLHDNELERLVAASTRQIRDLEPGYGPIAERSLTDQMRRTISLALLRVSGDPVPPEIESAAYETGQLRAIQQIDVNAVSRSFRIDLRMLWEAFLEDAQQQGIGVDHAYVAELVRVWQAVEVGINQMAEGYRVTAEKLRQQNDGLRAAAFRLLLEGDGGSATARTQLTRLSFDATWPVVCIVSAVGESEYSAVSAVQGRLALNRVANFFGRDGQYLVGLVQSHNLNSAQLVPLMSELGAFRTGVVHARSPEGIVAAIRNGRALVAAVDAAGIRTLRDDWLAALAVADTTLTDSLAGDVFEKFDDLSNYVRGELTRFIECYLATDGTVAAIGKAMFRHRNTVRSRLSQVQELTGLDLSLPADVSLLAVAFEAWRTHKE